MKLPMIHWVSKWMSILAFISAGPSAATGAHSSNALAISGTWVLQQVSSPGELSRLSESVLKPALATPGLRGFCLRVPWQAIGTNFNLLDQGLLMARANHLAYSLRFMAGRHTPEPVFADGCRFYRSERSREKVPAPFLEDGSPNLVFEKHYEVLVSRLAGWCRTNQVRLLHLAWYGQEWAELNHGKEVRALKGYTYENWLRAHQRLLDIGLKHSGDDLTVEFPFSGHGPLTDAAVALAEYVIQKNGPRNQNFYCQANGWGPNGDWGAPSAEVEKAFDRVWALPICRGQQAIQPADYDWKVLYQKLYENHATYCEVYAPSFTQKRKSLLRDEISRFARTIQEQGPLLPAGK
jgi:hypothetical protein